MLNGLCHQRGRRKSWHIAALRDIFHTVFAIFGRIRSVRHGLSVRAIEASDYSTTADAVQTGRLYSAYTCTQPVHGYAEILHLFCGLVVCENRRTVAPAALLDADVGAVIRSAAWYYALLCVSSLEPPSLDRCLSFTVFGFPSTVFRLWYLFYGMV